MGIIWAKLSILKKKTRYSPEMLKKLKRLPKTVSAPMVFFIISIAFFCFVLEVSSNDPIHIKLKKNEVITYNFYGFGAETLPWLWMKENLRQGINKDDIKLNIERIKEMELPLARIFVPWEIWNPSGDYETFAFNSDGMQSLYKALDVYQEIGTSVVIVTVDWLRDLPWRDVRRSADAVLRLLEYLVKDKGYDCIHFWTLTNEPELTYGWLRKSSFEDYIQIHKLVKAGLREKKIFVKIITADEVESEKWFKDSVEFLFDSAEIFSSHKYIYPNEIEYIRDYFKERIEIINSKGKSKPFFLCEFGFRGLDFNSHNNSFMRDFDYGFLAAELCIDALNSGVSGVSIWCLHEILMPDGKKMNIGLWGYKDENWQPRPVFYAYSLFTKYIKRGSRVLETENSGYPHLKVACIEYNGKKSIFLLNKSNLSHKIIINGLGFGQSFKKYLYSSTTVSTKEQQMLKPVSLIKTKNSLRDKIPAKSLVLYTNF